MTPIVELNVQDVARYYVTSSNKEKFKNARQVLVHHSNFTKNRVVPILEILYSGKETDIKVLKKCWNDFTKRSCNTREAFCKSLLVAIENEENISIKMKSVVKTQQTNKELQNQIDSLLSDIALQKNLVVKYKAHIKSQGKRIDELEEEISLVSNNNKLVGEKLQHQKELVEQKNEQIKLLNMLVPKST